MDCTASELRREGRSGLRLVARLPVRIILVACVITSFATQVWAAGLESLISPGDLIAAHEQEVEACSECHERFDQSSQNKLCLECHEDIESDLQKQDGLHGRIGRGAESECRVCHTEHKGANADILGLVAETFDHRRTDFALEGGHAAQSCVSCHAKGEAYRDASKACSECHEKDDPHEGTLGDRCQQCHSATGWSTVVFDHDETRFALSGLHAEAACADCHPQQRFGKVAMDCVSCHRVDDVHRGRLGTACAECHDSKGWNSSGFDHARETRFALRGAHAKVDCRTCHESDPKTVKISRQCASCHQMDDDHRGSRGRKCGDCHGSINWSKTRFDHQKDTKFALHGAHTTQACELCHVGAGAMEKGKSTTPSRCVECHESDDVHLGSMGSDCSTCHAESSWSKRVGFDHDLTDFPLLALHQLASCEDCHVTHQFGSTKSQCVACHARGDPHGRRLGSDCQRCHNPNGWRYWFFEHARETGFALTGAHEGLQCEGCHVKPTSGASNSLEVSKRCSSCHLGDSPHDDAFGRDCVRCHVDDSWERTEQGVK